MKTPNLRQPLLRLLVALILGIAAASNAAADEMTVNIGYYPGATMHMIAYVADAEGFYKEEGLKATLTQVGSGPLMNSLLASGEIDFGYQPPSQLGLARERGLKEVFISGNVKMPWVVIARNGVKLPHKGNYPAVISDLKGLKWGVIARGSDNELIMRAMAADAKLNAEKDMTWLAVGGPPTGLPALKAGTIDVYITHAPADTIGTSEGYAQTVIDMRKGEGPKDLAGIHFQGLVTLEKTARERPNAVNAIVSAHAKAYCWIRDNKNLGELMKIVRSKVAAGSLSDDQFREIVKGEISALSVTMPTSDFAAWNDLLLKGQILRSPLQTKEILWNSVLERAPC